MATTADNSNGQALQDSVEGFNIPAPTSQTSQIAWAVCHTTTAD